MTATIGVLLALGALVLWGVADFLIQRSARLVGSVKTMFLIGLVAVVAFLPFVVEDLRELSVGGLMLLLLTGIVLTAASLFDFEALREGKMAVAEPVVGLEMPLTVLLAVFFAGESLSLFAILLIASIFIGTLLIVTRQFSHLHYHKRFFERGVRLAIFAAGGLAAANFLVGASSQESTPFLALWWVGLVHFAVCAAYLIATKKLSSLIGDLKRHPKTLLGQAIVDDAAWLAFAGAVLFIPIAIATAISSGYVALAVLLGIFINKESLRGHQYVGIVVVCIGIVVLAHLYS